MNRNLEIINISSDSSSDESWDTSPLPPYFPPYRLPMNGTRTKEQARKMKHAINSPILSSLSTIKPTSCLEKEFQEQTSDLIKKLPIALTHALEKVVSSMMKIPVPDRAQLHQKCPGPLKVGLGFACPRLWDKEMKARGMYRSMPDPKDKGL